MALSLGKWTIYPVIIYPMRCYYCLILMKWTFPMAETARDEYDWTNIFTIMSSILVVECKRRLNYDKHLKLLEWASERKKSTLNFGSFRKEMEQISFLVQLEPPCKLLMKRWTQMLYFIIACFYLALLQLNSLRNFITKSGCRFEPFQ